MHHVTDASRVHLDFEYVHSLGLDIHHAAMMQTQLWK